MILQDKRIDKKIVFNLKMKEENIGKFPMYI